MGPTGWGGSDDVAALRAEVAELRQRLERLEAALGHRPGWHPGEDRPSYPAPYGDHGVGSAGDAGIEPTEPWNLGPGGRRDP